MNFLIRVVVQFCRYSCYRHFVYSQRIYVATNICWSSASKIGDMSIHKTAATENLNSWLSLRDRHRGVYIAVPTRLAQSS